MATLGNYAGALGGMAKDAAKGAGNAFVGGLKGAFLRETPGLTAGYAFAKELSKRANSTKMASGGTPPLVNQQASTSSAMGGFGASVTLVAGQNKSNVINLEQVRQLKQLNDSVITQSKLIAFQVADQKRKDQFAEEAANEQAFRDDALLQAIKNFGGGGGSGKKGSPAPADGGGGIGSVISNVLSSFSGSLLGTLGRSLGPMLMTGLRFLIGPIGLAITAAVTAAFAAYKFFGSDSKPTPPKAPKPPPSPAAKTEMNDILKERAELQKQLDAAPFDKQPAIRKKIREHDEKYKDVQANGPSPVSRETYFERMGKAESGAKGNTAKNDQSTATGKYQFLAGTWQETVAEMASKGAIKKEDYIGLENRTDPEKARKVAEYFTEKNRATLKVTLGRDPTETDLYMSHFLGTSGGPRFLTMLKDKPNTLGIDAASKKAVESNYPIFFDAEGKPRTVGEIYALMSQKLGGNNSRVASGLSKDAQAKAEAEAKPPSKFDVPRATELTAPNQNAKINGNEVSNHYESLGINPAGGRGSTSNVGLVPVVAKGGGGGGGDAGYPYSLSDAGGGTKIEDNKPISVFDAKADKDRKNEAKAQGINNANGTLIPSKAANYGKATITQPFKPLFKNNSDIIAETNKTFLQQFRSTATNAFSQALTKTLFPNGTGVSAAGAGRDDNYRGQQLQKIFGTDQVISDATTKLLGKQYGPMFAPLFNNLAQGYLEVGSRVAGKAIFQGIGGLDAQDTQTITGQVLGNYAAGNKKLAFEQLLYGASGGKNGGIALGPETLLAKYGFNNPAEGIQYFASALGERATQPFAQMMGADNRNRSIIFDPRTKQYVYADTGERASQADIQASGNYGAPVSQSTVFSPGMNNYGMAFNPYGTTAGVNGTYKYNGTGSQFQQMLESKPGTGPSRAQYFGLTDQQQAAGGDVLVAKQNTLLAAQVEQNNQQMEQQRKLAEEGAKRQLDIAMKQASNDQEVAAAQAAFDKTLNDAKTASDRIDTNAVIAKLDQVGGKGGGSGTVVKDANGNPIVRQSGQLFSQTIGPDGKVISDPMKEIGNFAFDMGKNMLGQQLTKDIKNPYAQMVANFAIQKGLNWGVDQLLGTKGTEGLLSKGWDWLTGSGGQAATDTVASTAGSWLSNAGSSIMNFFGLADGGIATQATPGIFGEKGAEAIIPLANPTATKALSAAMGTDKQLSALGEQTDLLSSMNNSLLKLSGGGSGSGTSISGAGFNSMGGGTGMSWDVGLGSSSGGGSSVNSGSGTRVNGVSKSGPSTMDYVTAIGTSVLKSALISNGIGMASTALFGATPLTLAGNFISGISTGYTYGASAFAGDTIVAAGTETGLAIGSAIAEGGIMAGVEAGLAAMGPVGWAVLGIGAVAAIFGGGYGGGGGGSAPPPKCPKFHAGIYVAGNNNINAIAPMYETTDYHAVPEGYKTIAYGLLKVAFNATKVNEQVAKSPTPYDWLYMKVQYDRISLLWGTGAPNPATLISDGAAEVKAWAAPSQDINLNSIAKDIIDLVRDEFKKTASSDNLSKIDQAMAAIGEYSLNHLSSGLVADLQAGKLRLDTTKEKGMFADNLAESNRIGALLSAASQHGAYITTATAAEYNDEGGISKEAVAGGVPMVWSMKDNAYVENKYPGALVMDAAGRPVYDIEGTSTGLTVADFVSGSVAGANRPANVLAPSQKPTTDNSVTNNQTNIEGSKVDNSSVTNFYNSLGSVTDVVRSTTSQVGVPG